MRALRSTAGQTAAEYMGIPSDRIYSIVMGLSAGIAAFSAAA